MSMVAFSLQKHSHAITRPITSISSASNSTGFCCEASGCTNLIVAREHQP